MERIRQGKSLKFKRSLKIPSNWKNGSEKASFRKTVAAKRRNSLKIWRLVYFFNILFQTKYPIFVDNYS